MSPGRAAWTGVVPPDAVRWWVAAIDERGNRGRTEEHDLVPGCGAAS